MIFLKFFLVCLLLKGFETENSSLINDSRCIGSGKHCNCDKRCVLFGDCCDKYEKIHESIASCYNGYYVIDKCIDNSIDINVKKKCEEKTEFKFKNLLYHVPVYGIYDNVSVVYKSAFCAVCNGKTQFDFARVQKHKISSKITDHDQNNTADLIYQYEIPIEFKRVCQENIINSCSYDSEEVLKMLCRDQPNFYVIENQGLSKKVYRNAYCFLCNSEALLDRRMYNYVIPTEIKALDFNEWCHSNCHELLELFKMNRTTFKNISDSITCVEKQSYEFFEKLLTVSFRIVSLISLVFMVLVFSCTNDHRNQASKITLSLTFPMLSLCITNIIISVVENPSSRFCFYFSIAYQFCFLSSFFWMSIFARDVYKSITSPCALRNKNTTFVKSKKLKFYFIIGYGAPLLLTITAVCIQKFIPNNPLNPSFGERHCFINRLIGGLVWFFIPLCICLLINIIICGALYRFIYSINQQTLTARSSLNDTKKTFKLCVKLSILFGAVWLPAFVGIFFNNYILKFIGGLLSSLHGLLLSLCFIYGMNIHKTVTTYLRNLTESMPSLGIRK